MGQVPPAYTARDMLDDALAVMNAVGWQIAHVMGCSMGAALAQGLTLENSDRVRSLVSAMGLPVTAGAWRTLRYIRPGVFRTLRGIRPGGSDEEQVTSLVDIYRAIASPGYPLYLGMGHNIPTELYAAVAGEVRDNADRAATVH